LLEKNLENAKIGLAMKLDFNLFDAFKIFDQYGHGYLSRTDLKIGLADIGIIASYDEIDLFFKRYDQDQDGKMRFSEFCDAMTPIDPYY